MRKKLKPNKYAWIPIAIGLAVSSLFGPVLKQFFHENTIQFFSGTGLFLLTLYGLFYLILTRNLNFIVMTLMLFFFALTSFLYPVYLNGITSVTFFLGVLFGVWDVFLIFTKKFKWRYRELLELAAKNVEDVTNGYTTRPLPLGELDYKIDEVIFFAQFLLKNMIVIPREEENRLIFIITWRIRYFWKLDYSDCSHVIFHKNGNITVKISKKDYLNYKDEFSFDQLCTNLGDLFIIMFDQFKKGDEIGIIDRLNRVKESPLV